MNATNRALNRAVLLTCGLVLLVAGAMAVLVGARPPWAETWLSSTTTAADDVIAGAGSWTAELPGIGNVPAAMLVLLGASLLLAILLLAFICTRARGKTRSVLQVDAAHGQTAVDRNVADAVLAGALAQRPDVLSARAAVYLVRHQRAVELAVTVQRGASLKRIHEAAEDAVREWDALLGTRVPVMVHLSDRSWREGFRSPVRVR